MNENREPALPALAARSDRGTCLEDGPGGKYLMFTLDAEVYAVRIQNVREIIGIRPITRVPQMPDYVKGVVNLRGGLIPVLDLRLRLGLDEAAHTDETCIVVLDVGTRAGMIVDTVQEVADIPSGDIEPPPPFGDLAVADFLLGIGRRDEKVAMLLDVDRILSADQAARIANAVGADWG